MTRTVPRGVLLAWAAGAALVVLGIALVVSRTAGLATGEFGWFAYAPYSTTNPRLFVVTSRELWGAAALALGLACVASGAGYLMGTRRTTTPGATAAD